MQCMNKFWFLFGLTFIVFMGALLYVLLQLPPEASQGYVQKIFFFHVPSAFAMYGCLLVGGIFSSIYLFEKKLRYDQWARASLYTATFFAAVVMVSGPVWAKPIWGVYWTWDPRLTTTFVVFILLIGYCFVRSIYSQDVGGQKKAPVIGAVLAILALLDVPLIHLSVKLWRGVHPSVIRNPQGLPPDFQRGLELMVLALFLLAAVLVWLFFKIIRLKEYDHG